MMKKAKLPFSLVYVAPFEFNVVHDPEVLTAAGGDAMLLDEKIVTNLTRGEGLLRDDIIHEVLHAIIRQSSLYQNNEEWAKQEEAIVSAMSPRILAVLRDNPELVSWLTA